jgi:hypothetical protein
MRRVPKHKIILSVGILFFVASPFLFWFMPQWILPLFCEPKPLSAFPCPDTALTIGTVTLFVSLAIGAVCMLWALRSKK